jgi:cyanophycinase
VNTLINWKLILYITEISILKTKQKMKATFIFIISLLYFSCKSELSLDLKKNAGIKKAEIYNLTIAKPIPTVISYLTGDATDVNKTTLGGLLLMGGSTDVDAAIAWQLNRSGGGDIVVLRATGADGYNTYMYNMVPVNSVETIIIDSREKANLPEVAQKIRNAEALFIAGGDQWDYVNYWKNTAVEDAINYLSNTKNVTVGGTSAGLAILGNAYYSAENGTVTSAKALANPYLNTVTIGVNDFLSIPYMQNIITDSHYTQRDRQGRHITFMARLMKDFTFSNIKGIGIDEETAVCIDQTGNGKVFGLNSAYFLNNNSGPAETCISKKALNWVRNNQAVKAYKITGSASGNGVFNISNWAFSGGTSYYYYVNNGLLVAN